MNNKMKELSLVAGAAVAINVGAGFSSGQEIFQFFSSYGLWGFIGGIISFFILVFTCESIIDAGWVNRFCNKTSVFEYFCGTYIGKIYNIIIPVILFGSFIIMMSGFGTILQDFFKINNLIGRLLILGLVIGSVFVDFQQIVQHISKIGKIITGVIVLICFIAILKNSNSLFENIQSMKYLNIISAGHTYYFSGILYAGMILLGSAQFLFEMGRSLHDRENGYKGILIGMFAFMFSAMIINLAILLNIKEVYNIKIITLYFAKTLMPIIEFLIATSIAIMMGSSCISVFWSTRSLVQKKFTIDPYIFRISSIFLAVAGYFLAQVPFDILVNVLYPINGAVGISLIIFICVKNRIMARQIHS